MTKSIITLKIKIDDLEKYISLFFILNSNLRNENISQQIKYLSKLNKTIGLLFDMYRDYSLLKSKIKK